MVIVINYGISGFSWVIGSCNCPISCPITITYSNKRRGAYLIFCATSAALIRGQRLLGGI